MISIIVPNYNHSFLIPLMIKGYQKYQEKNQLGEDEVEMIIIDDNSDDPFLEMLHLTRKYIKPWFKIRVFETNQRMYTPTVPINIGVKKARGDVIIINSADIVPSSNVLPTIIHEHKDAENLYLMPKLYMDMRCCEWQETCACVSMKKKVYEELGGWDERLKFVGVEDLDFLARVKRYGCVVKRDPSMVYMHIGELWWNLKIYNMDDQQKIFLENNKNNVVRVNPNGWGELDTLEELGL